MLFKWKMPCLHFHIPWKAYTPDLHHSLEKKREIPKQWSRPNEKIQNPDNTDGLLPPAKSIPTCINSTEFATELKQAVRTNVCESFNGEEEEAKDRNVCKVFPSFQANASKAAQERSSCAQEQQPVVPDSEADGEPLQVTRHLKCIFTVFPWKCKWRWPGWSSSCRYKSNKRSARSRGTCRTRKMLIKFRNKVCISCRLNAKDTIPEASADVQNMTSSAPSTATTAGTTKTTTSSSTTTAAPVAAQEGCIKGGAFLERAPSSDVDPEYWINTDNDYVVLVVSSSKHEEENPGKE